MMMIHNFLCRPDRASRMAESRDEGEAQREAMREMISHCETMQDEAKAWEVCALLNLEFGAGRD